MAKKKEVPVEAVEQEAMHQTDGVQVDNELVPVKSSEKKASSKAAPKTEKETVKGTRKKSNPGNDSETAKAESPKPKAETKTAVRREPDTPRVVSIDEKIKVITNESEKQNMLLDLLESLRAGRILTDMIQGVEMYGDEPCAVLYHGEFKVIIPGKQLIEPPEDTRGQPEKEIYRYLVMKRLGAEVDYVIKGVDQKADVAVASRLEAMYQKRRAYYTGTDRNGNRLLYEGALAEARVTSVIRPGMFVELFGVDTYVPLKALSYQRWADACEHFQPGDRVIVKIMKLERINRNNIKVVVSVKHAGENPYEKALKKYTEGNSYIGTVSMVNTSGVFVAMEHGIDCLCEYPKRGRPPIGARVTVRILGIDRKRHRMWGSIAYSSMTY